MIMELINKIINHLETKKVFQYPVTYEKINVGASGAILFVINDCKNKYILKNSHPSYHNDEGHKNSYFKELSFYMLNKKMLLPFVPETIYLENHPDYGILLVMCYYEPVKHNEWNEDLLLKATDLCAQLK